jgi:hypothetical protein
MKIFTTRDGKCHEGTFVYPHELTGAGISIPVVRIGEAGRGRRMGILPVETLGPVQDTPADPYRVYCGRMSTTKRGAPKLIETERCSDSSALVAMREPIGFRGSNSFTGDLAGWGCKRCSALGEGGLPSSCPKCNSLSGPQAKCLAFPGEIIVEGRIAEGAAGYAGAGRQLIAVVRPGDIWSVGYSGRRYSAPNRRYYRYDGEALISMTWGERLASDLF